MAPSKHALLGASKAHQWLKCPPSVRWELEFPEPETSEAAAEGTVAHALAEDHLQKLMHGKRLTVPKEIKEDPLFRPVMVEHVRTYCDYIMEQYTELQTKGFVTVYMEQELDLSFWVPEGFGTTDCVMVGAGELHVFDFKYGKGVPVDAAGNPQLRLYALGALEEFDYLFDFQTVTMHIVQPRLDSITSETLTVEELLAWGESVIPIAAQAFKGEGEFTPGEDQCRWCRCKPRCRAYQEYIYQMAAARFDEAGNERSGNELSDEEIGQILSGIDELKRWASGIAEWALNEAVSNGVHFKGWKLVEGRSTRKITDEANAEDLLEKAGYTANQTMKLRGLTELENLVGKKELTNLLGELIVKPAGKPTLVKDSDKRAEWKPENVFKKIEEEESNE